MWVCRATEELDPYVLNLKEGLAYSVKRRELLKDKFSNNSIFRSKTP